MCQRHCDSPFSGGARRPIPPNTARATDAPRGQSCARLREAQREAAIGSDRPRARARACRTAGRARGYLQRGARSTTSARGRRALQRELGCPIQDARSKSTMRMRRTGASWRAQGQQEQSTNSQEQQKQQARLEQNAQHSDYRCGGDDRGRPARRGARETAAQLGCGAGLGYADSHADDAATDQNAHAAPDAQADAADQGTHAQADRQADDVAADQANNVSADCSTFDCPAHDTDAAADGPARRTSVSDSGAEYGRAHHGCAYHGCADDGRAHHGYADHRCAHVGEPHDGEPHDGEPHDG